MSNSPKKLSKLPIEDLRSEISQALKKHNRIVLKAPTGSGKSTQIPQFLIDDCPQLTGTIIVLQPRRLPTRLLATRVAHERNSQLGDEVGYQIRFERLAGPSTRILFLTEGILLRQMQKNPSLHNVSAILFDEFHERHLYSDISLSLALNLQNRSRPDLKILIMSATLDGIDFSNYLGEHCLIESQGRSYPVQIDYLDRRNNEEPIWEIAAKTLRSVWSTSEGHALIFMPGAYEIQRSIQAIRRSLGGNIPIFSLHGEMTHRDQDQALFSQNDSTRRVIVSTNVAETSLTIDGVSLVIDSGLARIARFDPRRGIDTLLIEKISRSAAEQRAGRAGRTRPGRAIRLWTKYEHERLPAQELPEIKRKDLCEVILSLKAAGFTNLTNFHWFEKPDTTALDRAEALLTDLDAIDENAAITPLGTRMLSFPLHPRYARMLLAAKELDCIPEAALLAALTQSRQLLPRSKGKHKSPPTHNDLLDNSKSDFQRLTHAFTIAKKSHFEISICQPLGIHAEAARQVDRLFQQFLNIAKQEKLLPTTPKKPLKPTSDEAISKCLLVGFADQVARRRSAGNYIYELVHGRRGTLSRDSLARDSELIVVANLNEIGHGRGSTETVLSLAAEVQESWLRELFPKQFREISTRCFDISSKRIIERSEQRYRDLVLHSTDRPAPADTASAEALAHALIEQKTLPPMWNQNVDQIIERINFTAKNTDKNFGLLPIENEDTILLLTQICEGSTSFRELKNKPVLPIIKNWCTSAQWDFCQQFAPEKISLPSGRALRLRYEPRGPILAATIQQLFGITERLRIGFGKIPILVEILAPNQRPIQITDDIPRFWKEHYPEIKKNLQRRYPKHAWPEDPVVLFRSDRSV
ncbi:MAG: ATP-dependent helicase HrpB [Chthoniobacterales bacterium]